MRHHPNSRPVVLIIERLPFVRWQRIFYNHIAWGQATTGHGYHRKAASVPSPIPIIPKFSLLYQAANNKEQQAASIPKAARPNDHKETMQGNTATVRKQQQQQNSRTIAVVWLLLVCLLPNLVFLSWWRTNTGMTTTMVRQTQNVAQQHQTSSSSSSSTTTSLPRTFPRWGAPDGIPLQPVLDYMTALHDRDDPWGSVPLYNHSQAFPETSYIVDATGIRGYRDAYKRTHEAARFDRWEKTHRIFRLAYERLSGHGQAQWPMLHHVIHHGGGFPFLVWYGDNRKCNYHNWKNSKNNNTISLPIFVYCAPIDCNYTIPMPQFNTIKYGKPSASDWQRSAHNVSTHAYPWHTKINQVVWRGTLWTELPHPSNDHDTNKPFVSTREHLLRHYTAHPNPHLDVQAIAVVDTRDFSAVTNADHSAIGGTTPSVDMAEFQQYTAILDLDGMSWSSRFVTLLCYNSVILKVEPEFVDHFHFELEPWTHYIPVNGDLSDLDAKAAFATDPQNEAQILAIIANANAWCHERVVYSRVADDMLDTWSFYVQQLYQHDPHWLDTWNQQKHAPSFNLTMGVAPVTEWAETD